MQLLDAVNKRVATPHAVGLPMPVVFIGVTSSVWLVHVTSIFNSPSLLPFSLLCLSVLFLSCSLALGSVPCGNYNPTSSVLRCRRYRICVTVHLGHDDY